MDSDLGQLANDRYEIGDALHRFAFGLDHSDADSVASALAEDCRLDFRPAGRKLGLEYSIFEGRDAIVKAIIPLIGPLETTHTASNLQIEVDGDTATLYAYVLSQHFMPRESAQPGADFALLMNRYDCALAREGKKWKFKRITIDNAWAQGNFEILDALANQLYLQRKSKRSA